MLKNKKHLILITCMTAALIIEAGSLAVTEKPIRTTMTANTTSEEKILNVLKDMSKDESWAMWNITPEEGKLLYILASTSNAKNIVEIGTSVGYSTIWFCLALQTTGGKITTHEIDPYRIDIARNNFERAGASHLITIVKGDAHKTVTRLKEPIDILYIDADKTGYFDYFTKLLPLVRPGGLILAHNTTDQASKMQDFLKSVTDNSELETIFLHKQPSGLGVTLKKRK